MSGFSRPASVGETQGFVFSQQRVLGQYRYLIQVTVLASADVLAFVLAALLFRSGEVVPKLVLLPGGASGQSTIDLFSVLGTLFILVRYISGDYSQRRLFWDSTRSSTTVLLAASLPSLLLLALRGHYLSALAIIGSWSFLFVAIPAFRQLALAAMDSAGVWRLPTALVADGSHVANVYRALSGSLSLGFDIRWLVPVGEDRDSPPSLSHLKHLFLTDPGELAERLVACGCSQAVIVSDDTQPLAFANFLRRLIEEGISVGFVPSFRQLPLMGVTTRYFFGRDIFLFGVRNNRERLPHRFVKRAFDIAGSIALLILFSPLFAIAAYQIRRHDGGPVIYSHKRTGRHGVPFPCLKFRTMALDADEVLYRWQQGNPALYAQFLANYKLRDDPRITSPGRWLRRTSLDELPQLLNVLRGEMSLVGPRPVVEQELIEFYGPAAKLYKRVRPGLTGLWQVCGRSDTTYQERVVYDEWYILNWSFWYDIVIMLQTAWVVLKGKGAC
jgi:undecaprenyl-phosphate galactose phosphotransferase